LETNTKLNNTPTIMEMEMENHKVKQSQNNLKIKELVLEEKIQIY
jgi:hypothetical protein